MSLSRAKRAFVLLLVVLLTTHGVGVLDVERWALAAPSDDADTQNPEPAFVPTIEFCTTCPPDVLVSNLYGGQDFSFHELTGSSAQAAFIFPAPFWAGLTPAPGPLASGTCLCCVCWVAWEDQEGNLHWPPLDGPPSTKECRTGTGTGGTSVCVPEDVPCLSTPYRFCFKYPTPCVDDNGDGVCAGDDNNNNSEIENFDNQFGDDPLWGDPDMDGIPNRWDRYPEGPNGPTNDRAPLPTDPSRWLDYFELLGEGEPIPQEIMDQIDPAAADIDQDGIVTFAELAAALANLAQTSLQGTPEDPLNPDDGNSRADWSEWAKDHTDILQALENYVSEVLSPETFGGESNYNNYLDAVREQIDKLESFIELLAIRDAYDTMRMITGVLHVAHDALGWVSTAFGRLIDGINGSMGIPTVHEGSDGSPIEGGEPEHSTPDVPGGADSSAGDPVDTWTGAYNYTVTDLSSNGFTFQRFYDSRRTSAGIFGHNWSMKYLETRLMLWETGAGQTAAISWGDGTTSTYFRDPASSLFEGRHDAFGKIRWHAPQFSNEPECELTRPGLTLREPDGTLYYFCPPSRTLGSGVGVSWLRKIVDPHGNAIAFQRDVAGRPTQVVDVQGLEYDLSYDLENKLVTEITGPAGRSVTYTYDLTEGPVPPSEASGVRARDPIKKRDLIRADYTKTIFVKDDQLGTDYPYEEYSYFEDPAGFAVKPLSLLNHNLKSITNPNGTLIQIEYGDTPGEFSYDRVVSYDDADERRTALLYESLTPTPDEFGQSVQRETAFVFPGGSKHTYHHGDNGLLLRAAVHNGQFDLTGAQTQDPVHGPDQWVTIYGYNSDLKLIEQRPTTDTDPLGGQKTTWDYDDQNVDRFQQGNTILVTSHDRLQSPAVTNLVFVYDPVVNRPFFEINDVNTRFTHTFAHQELTAAEALALPTLEGWEIDISAVGASYWGKGDVNGDGALGGSHQRISTELSPIDRATPTPGVTVPDTPQITSRYDAQGRLVYRRTAEGIETLLEYTPDGLLAQSTTTRAGISRVERHAYDVDRRLVATVHHDGRVTQYRYDSRGSLIESMEFPTGYLVLKSDPVVGLEPSYASPEPDVIVSRFFFDLAGNPVGYSEPAYVPHGTPAYDDSTRIQPIESTTFTADALPASRTQRTYDGEEIVQSATWTFTYDEQRRPQSTSSPSIHDGLGVRTPALTTTLTRDPRGLVTRRERVDENGVVHGVDLTTYDDFGRPVVVSNGLDADGNGILDSFTHEYDGYGREVRQVSPTGDSVETDRDAVGRVVERRILNAAATVIARTEMDYDLLGRMTRLTRHNYDHIGQAVPGGPAQEVTEYGYGTGPEELLWAVQNPGPDERYTRYSYDALGRQVEVLTGLVGDPATTGSRLTLDPSGRVLSRTRVHNSLGNATGLNDSETSWTYAYDSFGRLGTLTDPYGNATLREYDAAGRLLRNTDPEGTTMEYVRDSWGRVLREVETGGVPMISRTTEYDYDAEGNLSQIVDAESNPTQFTHDAAGRRLGRIFADLSDEQYLYDDAGQLSRIHKANGVQISYDRDVLGRTRLVTAVGADAPVSVQYQYDTLGNVQGISDQVAGRDPVLLLRYHTSLGHVHAEFASRTILGSPFTRLTLREHSVHGDMTRLTLPSGNWIDYGYDEHGRLSRIDHSVSGGALTTVAAFTQPYGTGFAHAHLDPATGASLSVDVDKLGRVVEKRVATGSGVALAGGVYDYDTVGNLTCRTSLVDGTSDTYAYDGFHRLVDWWAEQSDCVSGGSGSRHMHWDHDRVDNLTQLHDTLGGTITPTHNELNQYETFGPQTGLSFNARGEETARSAGGHGYAWTWDALGRPFQSTWTVAGNDFTFDYYHDGLGRLVGRSTTDYEMILGYAGDQLIEAFDIHSGFKEYVNGPHGIWRYRSATDERLYLHVDPFQNVEAVHDGNNVVESYRYDPYGLPRTGGTANGWTEFVSSTVGNDLLFASAPYFADLKLVRMGARFYDPVRGGFISRDPLGEAESTNLYAYARANPFRYWDPSGFGSEQTQSPSDSTVNEKPAETKPSRLRFIGASAFAVVTGWAQSEGLLALDREFSDLVRDGDYDQAVKILQQFDAANREATQAEIERALREYSDEYFLEYHGDRDKFRNKANDWANKISQDVADFIYRLEGSSVLGRLQQITNEAQDFVGDLIPDEISFDVEINALIVQASFSVVYDFEKGLDATYTSAIGLTTVGSSASVGLGWSVTGGTGFPPGSGFGLSTQVGVASVGASVSHDMFRVSVGVATPLKTFNQNPLSEFPGPIEPSYTYTSHEESFVR